MYASPLGRAARVVNMSRLGHALTELSDPPVKALFVYNSNPAAIAPNQNTVLRGMARPDLFTVVHEQFWTDTADYADIVLPATTFLEHTDIQGAYGHYYVQLSDQAIAPVGEARSNVWLFGQLGQRIGFTEACFRDTEQEMLTQVLSDEKHADASTDARHHARPAPHASTACACAGPASLRRPSSPSPTAASARPPARASSSPPRSPQQGLDPLPSFTPPKESRHSADRAYPLEFLPRKADNYMNSTFANLAPHQKMESPTPAASRSIPTMPRIAAYSEGDAVDVFNDRGRIRLVAQIHTGVPAGVVASRLNWNKLSPNGSNVNALTSERLTDIGRGPTFYSTLVEVARVLARWLKLGSNVRAAANGTRPSSMNPPAAIRATSKTARSAASPTCSTYAGAQPTRLFSSMPSSKVKPVRAFCLAHACPDSPAALVVIAPVAIESAFQHERAEVRFWLQ